MIKLFKHLIDNIYINIAGVSAIVLSPVADAIGGNAFWYLFIVLFLLFIFGIYDERKKNKIMHADFIHIPLVVKVEDGPDIDYVMNNLVSRIEENTNLSGYEEILKKYHSINIDTLIFEYKGSIYNFDQLLSFMRILKYKINQIEKQLNGKVKFHIAYYKRPSVGFLLGTIFRTESVVVYQNNDFENRFYPVANVDSREYKERVDIFDKYEVLYDTATIEEKSVLLAIESSSHNLAIESSSLSEYKNIVKVKLKENGTIPYNVNWVKYSAEIYNIINQLQTKYSKIVIAHAMPESISFLLGMALENYWDIDITQYKNNDYIHMYNMKEIVYYD